MQAPHRAVLLSARELIERAVRYREMASSAITEQTKAALLRLADEFEKLALEERHQTRIAWDTGATATVREEQVEGRRRRGGCSHRVNGTDQDSRTAGGRGWKQKIVRPLR